MYDRPLVIINTMRIKGITYLPENQQVACLAGASLYEHHLIVKVAKDGGAEMRAILDETTGNDRGAYFECTAQEA